MKMNDLGLLNSLSSIINSGKSANIEYVLAEYILKNLYRISSMSISEITDECFTSRSAIRRFCEQLGYSNFSELKKSVNKLVFPSNLRFRDIKEYSSYQHHIKNLIDDMILDIDKQLNFEDINYLCQLIHKDVKVVLLCANNTSGTIIKFQQELMFASKVIHVISTSFTTNKVLKDLNDEDIIITVSASGKFAELSLDFVKSLKGHKFLITGNQEQNLKNAYESVFYISKNSISNDYLSIYGKYGITYILDLISMQYLFLYA
ncbi:transcriptional regulator [Robertmurraya siralis]|uniref:Transcriptional regulator n=1 Tax=Robertmurraya siralis TaxID=77777 RepID=A0A919WJ16_9BACI|nr:MurR/RpiR family transcriptional regulator [Robertmurraya siralis]GIN62594.1 transcriptional regulator [Robertmurraya siralis]